MKRAMLSILMLLMLAGVMPRAAQAAGDERTELKERFRQRFATLAALKREGKVGETHEGLAQAVKADFEAYEAGGQTVREFLADENRDRQRLYQLIAQETGARVAVVARRDAERRFRQAGANEYLLPESGEWVRKRDLR